MFVAHVDSESTPSGTKSGGLEWYPGDSDAGGLWPTVWESLGCSQNVNTAQATCHITGGSHCCPSHRCDNKTVQSRAALMIFTIWSLKSDHCVEASWLTKSFGLHVNGTSEMSWPLFTLASGSLTCNNSSPPRLFRDSRDVCKSAENTIRYNADVWDCYNHPKFSLMNFLHIEDCTK